MKLAWGGINSKTTFVTVNPKQRKKRGISSNYIQKQLLLLLIYHFYLHSYAWNSIQKQLLLLLICTNLSNLKLIQQNSKTTFVTVNLGGKDKKSRWMIYSKTTFVTVNLWAIIVLALNLVIQKQLLLLLIFDDLQACLIIHPFKNNFCYC